MCISSLYICAMAVEELFDSWEARYRNEDTPWDLGSASPPLIAYLQSRGRPKRQKILIPGGGRAHDAIWGWQNGFEKLFTLDIAPAPQTKLRSAYPEQRKKILTENFFEHQGQYDLILEQTFFCALDPKWRPAYVQKMKELLRPGGKLVGLLFDFPKTEQGPPFGGSEQEYRELFAPHFKIQTLERCYNSVPPRRNKELFFQVIKP